MAGLLRRCGLRIEGFAPESARRGRIGSREARHRLLPVLVSGCLLNASVRIGAVESLRGCAFCLCLGVLRGERNLRMKWFESVLVQ